MSRPVARKPKMGEWVVSGGPHPGDIGHCTRCGEVLNMKLPLPFEVVIAAAKAFVKAHSRCVEKGTK